MQDNNQSEKQNSSSGISWMAIIVLIVIGLFITMSRQNSSPLNKTETKQITNDVNYCRSVAAQYGQQGTQAFSQTYNSCMDGKGW